MNVSKEDAQASLSSIRDARIQTQKAAISAYASPMLILWGMKDFVFDADYLAEWQRRFPRAEVAEFQDAGHYVLEDEREPVVRRIRAFMKKN